MDMFSNLFSGSNSLVDGAKLVLIGSTIETARRVGQSAWTSFLSSFYLTAHFSEEDYPFDWLTYWLQRQPQWRSSREFETTTRTTTVGLDDSTPNDILDEFSDEQLSPEDALTPGKQKMSVVFVPTFDSTIGIYYKKHWLRVRRWRHNNNGNEMLSISVVARNNSVLKQLVLEAKKLYEADAEHRVNIYFADSHGSWRWTDSRTKRPLSSIVLNKGVKEMLLDDARDFLKSEKWYATRGIPFRRGYLLYGVPGSGKTSLIHALAGALALDIYVVSLSASWINDATLSTLMGRVPARCIVLLEDLDAAFTRSATRDDDNGTGVPPGASGSGSGNKSGNSNEWDDGNRLSSFSRRRDFVPDYNTLSLSGLLNSLDGVSAPEGRLLFATTNHLERLDPALTRPGRMDVWVEFKNASAWQAELLFKNFFSEPEENADGTTPVVHQPTAEEIAAMEKEFAFLEQQQNLESSGSSSPKTGVSESEFKITKPVSSAKSPEKEGFVPRDGSIPHATAGAEAMAAAVEEKEKEVAGTQMGLPPPVLEKPSAPMDPVKLAVLARQFAEAISDGEHSVASLQGYLLRHKSRPEAAVAEARGWVTAERDMRARMAREREERESKMVVEREKRRKEREELKRRADRDEMRKEREEQARIRKEDEEFAAEERKWAEEKKKAEEEAAKVAAGGASSSSSSSSASTPASTTEASTPSTPSTDATPAPATTEAAASTSSSTSTEVKTTPAVTEALPSPPASGTSTPAESVAEVDGQTPGAQSIVLVRPEAEASSGTASATASA